MNTLVLKTRMMVLALSVWLRARWLSFKDTCVLVFLNADTVTIRLLLAWASFFSAWSLILDSDKFEAPAYSVIAMFGNEHLWAAYFLAHWFGVHWRIFERAHSRPRWALVINILGFCVWFISSVGVSYAVGNIGLNTSMSLTLCVASAWSLFRTGLKRDVVSL